MFGLSTSVYRYRPKKSEANQLLHERLVALAEQYPTWGVWKLYYRLRLEGLRFNFKRIHRLYKEARLNLRRRTRKRVPKRVKQPLVQPLIPNLCWSMDFMRDSLFQSKPFRAFNVIDDFNREALNVTMAKSITSLRVIRELEQLIEWRGKPEKLRVDNGPEFIAGALSDWCNDAQRKIELVFIEKGKPSQNGYIERFNKTFREDVLDAHLFWDLDQAQQYADRWIWMYNNERPHESLANLTPALFLQRFGRRHLKGIIEAVSSFQPDGYPNEKTLLLNVAE